MKVDSYLIEEVVYCKKSYSCSFGSVDIGSTGIVTRIWNFCFVIQYNNKETAIEFTNFDEYFCTIKDCRKLKLKKLSNGSI